MDRLYDSKEYFLLRTDDTYEFYINELVGWDRVRGKIDRDPDYFGFTAEFISAEEQFVFPMKQNAGELPGGGKFIRDKVELYGPEVNIYFEFGILENSGQVPQFYGRLNLYDYNRESTGTEKGVTATIERVDFENKLRTRFDTPIRIWGIEDLDGNSLSPGTNILPLLMHSKQIIKESIAVDNRAWNFGSVSQVAQTHWIIPSTENTETDALATVIQAPLSVLSDIDPADYSNIQSPVANQLYQFKATEQGRAEFYFSGGAGFYSSCSGTAIELHAYQILFFRFDSSGVLKDQQTGTSAVLDHTGGVGHDFDFDDYFQTFCEIGDSVYVHLRVDHPVPGGGVSPSFVNFGVATPADPTNKMRGWTNKLRIKQWTERDKTSCFSYNWWEVLKYIVTACTGQHDRVISTFFGPGGAGHMYALTNGFHLRRFIGGGIYISFRDILKAMQGMFCVGLGYRTVAGRDYVVIEPMPNFFRKYGTPILRIPEISNYGDSVDKDIFFNEVSVGYTKFAEDGLNTLDDYSTKQTYLLPLKNIKRKKEIECPFVASAYLIEQQRREYYSENSTGSKPNDDTIFIVSYVEQTIYTGPINYTSASDYITFGKAMGLVIGDKFIISDSGLNNGTEFTVTGRSPDTEKYYVSPNPSAGSTSATLVTFTSGVGVYNFPERNENFRQVLGMYSPGTAYNLRTTPKHIFYEWAPFFNIGLFYNADTDPIYVTTIKNNTTLRTRFRPGEPNPLNVEYQPIEEAGTTSLSDYFGHRGQYLPVVEKLTCKLSYDQLALFRKAVRGELPDMSSGPDPRNYSFIEHVDDEGVWWRSFPFGLEYDFKKTEATLLLRKIEKIE